MATSINDPVNAQAVWDQLTPVGGIPASDLAAAAQASLGKADSAVQPAALAGKLDASLPAMQTVFDAGTTAQKAAFQSSVSGAGASVRQIATGCVVNDSVYASFLQTMSRTYHVARATVRRFRLVYAAWAATNNGVETITGADQTYRAAVVVGGVLTRVTFGGAVDGVCASGEEIVSDWIEVPLASGQGFHVLTWTNCTAGIVFTGIRANTTLGERHTGGVTATDRTGTDAVFSDAGGGTVRPIAIVGMSASPAVWLAGDSKQRGITDTVVGAGTTGCGEFARLVEPTYGYTNAGRSNERVQGAMAAGGYTRRFRVMGGYFTVAISNYGINDCNSASSAAAIYAALVSFCGDVQARGLRFAQATIAPQTTSTDGWVSQANQTVASSNAKRVPLNASIRGSLAFDWVIELADVCETARDSGIWRAGLTGDGTHETQAGNAYIRSQLVLPPL